ncbi:mycofactocin system FadH/OYE family oxidoreductase 2 [Tomitella fengzijianii]|uniref:mycofactocin system FadH/OYE family oxidoreductase 2 n=1 Tax=Tomitella fengzijianii TaxID=2597660 RepID=UPI00131E30FE
MRNDETPATPLLSSPLRLGADGRSAVLRNRVVFCAHLTNLAVDGLPNADHAAYYEARARGGAGLIITEEHTVHASDRPYEKLIRGYDPGAIDGYRAITDRVHAHGAVVLSQLNHNGAQGSSLYTRRALSAPSAVWDPMFREVPRPLDHAGIADIVRGFADTARHCRLGGFDGVELQCSQASLIRQFLASGTNLRDDEYGGTLARRARFLLEVIAAVRDALGPGKILGVRLAGEERVDGGITLDEAVAVARRVEATGDVDYINTSIGLATSTLHLIEASMATPAGYALHIPSALRAAVDLPVVGVGRFSRPGEAEAALRDGACDLVGVVRGQIADPDFTVEAVAALTGGTAGGPRVCSACNQECIGRVGFNRPIRCLQNPHAGRENATHTLVGLSAPARRLRVTVVGGGPAGMQAAAVAAERGHEVTLFESRPRLGGQIVLAAAAPYREGLAEITRDLARRCAAAGVRIECGVAVRAGTVSAGATPDAVVVATGALPDAPEWARGLPVGAYADVREVLAAPDRAWHGTDAAGSRVLVVDGLGFHPATSVAEFLAARGCAVTVCTDGMVVGQDLGVTLDREGWLARAHRAGIRQRADTVIAAARRHGAGVRVTLVHHPTGAATEDDWDRVVFAGQQRSDDTLWRALTGGAQGDGRPETVGAAGSAAGFRVYRIGDALAPRRADAAIREGERVGAMLGSGAAPGSTSAPGSGAAL